jgi:hypothetical protein
VADAKLVEQISIEALATIANELGLNPQVAKRDDGGKAIGCRFPSGPGMVFLLGTRDYEPAFGFVTAHPGKRLTAAQANDWNRRNGFGALSVDEEGIPWLRHSVLLRGGVTKEFVYFQFGLFEMMIKSFVQTVGR